MPYTEQDDDRALERLLADLDRQVHVAQLDDEPELKDVPSGVALLYAALTGASAVTLLWVVSEVVL